MANENAHDPWLRLARLVGRELKGRGMKLKRAGNPAWLHPARQAKPRRGSALGSLDWRYLDRGLPRLKLWHPLGRCLWLLGAVGEILQFLHPLLARLDLTVGGSLVEPQKTPALARRPPATDFHGADSADSAAVEG